MTVTASYDHLVIGAGLAGAATAWRLAQQGHEVALLERSHPAHAGGSSHGSARIFRYAYAEPLYTDLVVRSRPGWDELETLAGERLVTPTGSLDHGQARHPEALARVLEGAGVEHTMFSAERAAERWPQFTFETPVLWHPAAGVIDAERSVEAMVAEAVAHGAQLLTDTTVTAIERDGRHLAIRTDTGATFTTGHVVIAAGGWLTPLLRATPLPASVLARVPAMEVRQENAFHFPYRDQHDIGPDAAPWPTFIHKSADIQVYGLPGGRDAQFAGQKVAEYNGGRIIGSAADQTGTVDGTNRDRVVEYVRQHLPHLVPEPYAETTCLFTTTPTEDFLIDRFDDITVLSACSGHGAKFAPLLGELAAGLATSGGSVPDEFRLAHHTR